jgi:hypothetical protein
MKCEIKFAIVSMSTPLIDFANPTIIKSEL